MTTETRAGQNDALRPLRVHEVSLDGFPAGCHSVTLDTDLRPSVVRVLNEQRLAPMRPTAFIINTSRDRAVDKPALNSALVGKYIASAALPSTIRNVARSLMGAAYE